MSKETIVTQFTLKGREILSSYASFTLEGVMTARVKRGKDTFTIEESNGIAKGTSDGEAEAIYIPNNKAIKSSEKNIAPNTYSLIYVIFTSWHSSIGRAPDL